MMIPIRASLHKSSRLFALALLVLAFGAVGHAQTGGSGTTAVTGAPSGQVLQYDYTVTTTPPPACGQSSEITTTYNSFNFDGYPLTGTAQLIQCGEQTTSVPVGLNLPSSYDPGYSCYITFEPREGYVEAELSCTED